LEEDGSIQPVPELALYQRAPLDMGGRPVASAF